MNKTMMLVTSTWDREKTFKLIPVSPDSPYNEGIFDPENKVLAVISKEKKQTLLRKKIVKRKKQFTIFLTKV